MRRILALLTCLLFTASCESDYTVMTREPEVIEVIVEVPGPTEYVEVPTGTPAEEVEIWIDSFVQVRAVDGVDIVWVIDTSGSMSSFQTQLLEGIEEMMSALPATGWRLVMVAADPDEAAIEQQFPLVPGDTIADAQDMYDFMGRGHKEQGFDSIEAYIGSNPYAATWMRNDAALLVVFVSDEDDQSNNFTTPSDFISWYTGRRFGNVFLASVVMQDESTSLCDGPSYGTQVGERYMDATSLLFGTIVDICADDWTPGVTDATSQIEPYESIELSHTPVEQTIRVFVGGNPYTDWTYDAGLNTVFFTVVPDGGALVEVGYVIQGA